MGITSVNHLGPLVFFFGGGGLGVRVSALGLRASGWERLEGVLEP